MANKNIVDLINHLASVKADASSTYTKTEVNSLTNANKALIEANTQADINNFNSLKEFIDANGNSITELKIESYQRSNKWEADKLLITTPSKISVNINDKFYTRLSSVTINISNPTSWDDTTAMDYTVASNRAGKDFFIYAIEDENLHTIKFLVSANSTVPVGYTADSSRKIAGFHCLCLDVGTIEGHPASGYITGDIIPNSIWDLKFRAMTDTNDGLVYVKSLNKWVAIYLPSWDGSKLVSVYKGAIVDGGSSFPLDGEQFAEYIGEAGGELPSRDEFKVFSFGSNQLTNINGSADPGTTGGHTDTAGRRMISNYFIEDCCGVLWQWSKDCYEAMSTSWNQGDNWMSGYSWQTQSVVSTIGPSDHKNLGSCYGLLRRALLGGSWGSGSACGSRSVFCHGFGSHVPSNVSGRLVSGALNLS